MISKEDQEVIDRFTAQLHQARTLEAIRNLQARKELLASALEIFGKDHYILYELRGYVLFSRWFARQNNNIRHGWAEDKFPEELREFSRYLRDTIALF